MTTEGRAFNKMGQGFQGKLALNHDSCIGFANKLHIIIGFGTEYLGTCEIAFAGKDQIIADRFDLNTVRNTIQIADDFLEITSW